MTNDEMKRDARKAVDDVQGRISQGPVQEKISEHSEVYDDMPEYEAADNLIAESEKAAKNRSWMWVAVAIALLLGAAICVLMIPEFRSSKPDNVVTLSQTAVSNGVDKASQAAETGMTVIEESVVDVKEGVAGTANAAADAVGSAGAKVSATSADAASAAGLSSATIEDEARRVIHGDFGNGEQRKAALGSHYAAVQHRVNEILHV